MRRRKIIIFIVAVGCAWIVFAFYRFITEPFRAVAREVALIRQDGEPAEWSEILAAQPKIRDNAAPIYQQAFALLNDGTPEEKDAFSHFISINPQSVRETNRDAVRRVLAKNQRALALARQAATKPAFRFPEDWGYPYDATFSHYAKLRHCARLLTAQGRWQKEAGDVEGGIATARVALRMAKQMESEHPTMIIGMLVRCALYAIALQGFQEILRDAEVSPQTYRALLEDLKGHDVKPALTRAFIAERGAARLAFRRMKGGQPLQSIGGSSPPPQRRVFNPAASWWLAYDEAFFLRLMRRAIQISKQPGYDWVAIRSVQIEASSPSPFYVLSPQLMPVFTQTYKKPAGVQARVDLLRLAIALRLYRREHGSYPADLNALPPQYLPAVPLDPFTNQPFRYRREGKGFLLYSFGENRRDDGGAFDPKWTPRDDVTWRSMR